MILRRTAVLLVVTTALALLVTSGQAAVSGAVLDQNAISTNSTEEFGGRCCGSDPAQEFRAQTFTAGVTGQLTDVVVPLTGCDLVSSGGPVPCSGPDGSNVDLWILPLDSKGRPNLQKILGGAVIPKASIPDQPFAAQLPPLDIAMASPIPVTAGTKYAITLHEEDGPTATNKQYYWLSSYSADLYAGGEAWWYYNGGWAPLTPPITYGEPAYDQGFQTYVIPSGTPKAGENPAVWIGSPVVGTWGATCCSDTVPPYHHLLANAKPTNDWSVDLSSIPSTDRAVYVYAAPNDTALNDAITAKVTQIIDDNACKNGGGGDLVTVGFFYGSTSLGQATYAHLDRDPSLYMGEPISRWGGYLGNVAVLSGAATGGSACWTGPHVHLELRASQHYACWNKDYPWTYPVNRTNFVGFISGSFLQTKASKNSSGVTGWPCP